MTLTPCLPHKTCVICESRLFGGKGATEEEKRAKLLHQAQEHGSRARKAILNKEDAKAYAEARRAAEYGLFLLPPVEDAA
jgi:hypothetical protein